MSSEAIQLNNRAPAQHRLGLALVAVAALFWSTSGIFVRLISADLMTMQQARSLENVVLYGINSPENLISGKPYGRAQSEQHGDGQYS